MAITLRWTAFPVCFSAWVLLGIPICQAQSNNDILYDGCDIQDYYAGLLTSDGTSLRDDVTRQDLESLLESTHRKVLPYTNKDRDDVWKALIDLDPAATSTSNSGENSVRLLYRQVDVPALPHGTSTTWNREHIWPKSRGVEYTGPDFTDIHHLKPSDANVNSARSNSYFGACGIAEPLVECVIPAHSEAAVDTASDSVTFEPPAIVRGDVARAIFYMDVRYSDQNNDGLDLSVTDCPTDQPHEMAYKSELLEWHAADAVIEEERYRNQRACERWQGNRNPFVDFPELLERFFGLPQTLLGDGLGYPGCDNMTPAPNNPSTSSPVSPSSTTENNGNSQCNDLDPADIMMVSVNSDTPELVTFVALKDLKEGLVLFMTDNAWTGSSFRTNEGTLSFRVPTGGIAAGSIFGYGDSSEILYSSEWESEGGQLQLSASGDTILLYCRGAGNSNVRFLAAVDYSGDGWMDANLQESAYGTSNSALPSDLASAQRGGLALPHFDNYYYTGSTAGTVQELQTSLSDPSKWDGSNDPGNAASLRLTFSVASSPSSPGTSPTTAPTPSPGDIMVVAMNSANPDYVALVALESLPGSMDIYLTDNAWTGTSFRSNEGTLKLALPSSGISAGTIFGYGGNILYGGDWESVGGRFALSESGDTILIFTKEQSKDEITHLGALSYTGVDSWADAGMAEDTYDTDTSALPSSLLSAGAISLPHQENYAYAGPTTGNKAFLQTSLQNAGNWQWSSNPAAAPTDFDVKTSNLSSSGNSLVFASTTDAAVALCASFALSYIVLSF